MRLKFSVGVSEAQADRRLLERRRKAPRPRSLGGEADCDRALGWPPAPSTDEDEDANAPTPPLWAW